MTLVAGLPRDDRITTAVHLATLLARSLGDDLLGAVVLPPGWPAGMGRVDAEYQQYLDADAQATLDRARALVPPDVTAEFATVRARSASVGLIEVAQRHDAGLVVLGSSAAGVLGRVAFGSVADRLLHTSPLPVALAPRGYRAPAGARATRVTAAFSAAEGSAELVHAAAGLAQRLAVPLRVASFAVRPPTPLTAGIGSRAEAAVTHEWVADVERSQEAVLEGLPCGVEKSVIGHGTDWPSALEDVGWADGDLLAVGSSPAGPVARVFLGSRSSRIIRHSPVPVIMLPRGAA